MFLPRAVQDGMFMDGTIYAALAKGLAEGQGSFWAPIYKSLGDGSTVFYMHPGLKPWLQSGFFRLFHGDWWWIERFYTLLELALHLLLLRAIGRMLIFRTAAEQQYDWLPALLWYLIPVVSWAMPNNMLENTLGVFTLLAVWAMLRGMESHTLSWFVLSGLCVWAAFLSKGPVGLFPLAVPFLLPFLDTDKVLRPWTVFFDLKSYVPTLAFVALFAAFWQYPPARHFFGQYWDLQIRGALDGSSVTTQAGWRGHLYLVQALLTELALPLALVGLAALWASRRGYVTQLVKRPAIFFLLGVVAVSFLPMLLSIKQRGFYLLPVFPWAALALSAWALPLVQVFSVKKTRWLRIGLFVGWVALLAYCAFTWGRIGRERAYVAFARRLERVHPAGGQVCVCQAERMNYALEAYLQRYAHFTITDRCEGAKAAIYRPEDCTEVSRNAPTQYRMDKWVLEIFE